MTRMHTPHTVSGEGSGGRVEPVPVSDEAWDVIVRRDRTHEGAFLYGVRTTGVYCRPGCASRLPRRENVRLFATVEHAERSGFRECKRCRPRGARDTATESALARARALLEEHAGRRITLEQLGLMVKLSPFHLQRTFKARFGVTPREYADALRAKRFRNELRAGRKVTSALYGAGYGSASRAYQRADTYLGMTPGTYKRGGEGMEIRYATVPTGMGELLVAATDRGLCSVALGDDPEQLEDRLRTEFSRATILRADGSLEHWVSAVAGYVEGEVKELDLPLDLSGTAFQQRVWKELQAIPYGETRSYMDIAAKIGRPTAVRAVGSAIARNRIAVLIPCHRVIRNDGALSGYRWGADRKKRLLELEKGKGKGGPTRSSE